jgi:hypothetical protein
MELLKFSGDKKPMAHNFFFQLVDTSQQLKNDFIKLCVTYLSGHPGQLQFFVGSRVLRIDRDVSGTNFEISVNMVFKDFDAYQAYSQDPRHEKFIEQAAGMSPTRVVFDSFLETSTPLDATT